MVQFGRSQTLKIEHLESTLDMEIDNINIASSTVLITPKELKRLVPVTDTARATVFNNRQLLRLSQEQLMQLFILVIGPCSVHDPQAVLRYFGRLTKLRQKFGNRILFVARIFVEKHRTGLNWPGYLMDPGLDGSYDLGRGLVECRKLLMAINEMEYPVAMEVIDPLIGAYLGDLLTVPILGARTVQFQPARYMGSGESGLISAKNATDGSIEPAIEALKIARTPGLPFTGPNEDGQESLMFTRGNPGGFLILRGGSSGPNFDPENVLEAIGQLGQAELPQRLIIDTNHKQHDGSAGEQMRVWRKCADQLPQTRPYVAGFAVESFSKAGRQLFEWPNQSAETLDPDCSVTDYCSGWVDTERMVEYTYNAL